MILKEENWVYISEYLFEEEDLPMALEFGKELMEATRKEPGCLLYHAHQSFDNPCLIILYQVYRDEEALNFHLESRHYQEIGIRMIRPKMKSIKVNRIKPVV